MLFGASIVLNVNYEASYLAEISKSGPGHEPLLGDNKKGEAFRANLKAIYEAKGLCEASTRHNWCGTDMSPNLSKLNEFLKSVQISNKNILPDPLKGAKELKDEPASTQEQEQYCTLSV